jgi:hypothetical protein
MPTDDLITELASPTVSDVSSWDATAEKSGDISQASDTELAPVRVGARHRDRIASLGPVLTAFAMAFALAGCWPFPSSTSSNVEVSNPVDESQTQTAEANDAVAERFPSLDADGRIDEAARNEAAKRERELDLLRAVRPDAMPVTPPNTEPPWPTEERPANTMPPEPTESPPQIKQADRPAHPAEDEVRSRTKSPQDTATKPPIGEESRRPDVEQARRPHIDESRSPKVEESRGSKPQQSRPPRDEESRPSNAGERPLPKAEERRARRIAHRPRPEPTAEESPAKRPTKRAGLPHDARSARGARSATDARASLEKVSIPPVGQLTLPPALRPTRPPL